MLGGISGRISAGNPAKYQIIYPEIRPNTRLSVQKSGRIPDYPSRNPAEYRIIRPEIRPNTRVSVQKSGRIPDYPSRNPAEYQIIYPEIRPNTRAGNSLIWFPSELLVFCPKISEWAIRSKKWAIHSFAHFWWATWAIRSHRSFLVCNLSDSLTSLTKKEEMSHSLNFFNEIFFLNRI